ncbi:MAG: rhodanese-like domain-containing protein [Gemmatimonadota bacterium]
MARLERTGGTNGTIQQRGVIVRLESIAACVVACAVLGGCVAGAPEAEAPEADAPTVVGERVTVDGGEYTNIAVPELQAMLEDKDFPLINVHIPYAGDLPGTDDSIPYNEIGSHLDRLPADKGAKIVLYCRTGPMSVTAARELVTLGYTNVYNLVGGITAWIEWGLPLAGT